VSVEEAMVGAARRGNLPFDHRPPEVELELGRFEGYADRILPLLEARADPEVRGRIEGRDQGPAGFDDRQ
jgi:hypothetical protein